MIGHIRLVHVYWGFQTFSVFDVSYHRHMSMVICSIWDTFPRVTNVSSTTEVNDQTFNGLFALS